MRSPIVREGEQRLQSEHHPVEQKADDANRQHRDHDLGQRLFRPVLKLIPDELA